MERIVKRMILQMIFFMKMKTVDVYDFLTDRERETITDLLMEAYVRETNETPFLFEVQTNIIVEDD